VSGSAPNRVFHIEWRAAYYSGGGQAHFELNLYENQTYFNVIYDVVTQGGASATIGVQDDIGSHYTQYLCNSGSIPQHLILTFSLSNCSPGPTPTPTATRTSTPTISPTRIPTRKI